MGTLEEFHFTGVQTEEQEEELGDILFCLVSIARFYKIDPETALRMANLKFYERVRYAEEQAAAQGMDVFERSRENKERYWNECRIKQHSKK